MCSWFGSNSAFRMPSLRFRHRHCGFHSMDAYGMAMVSPDDNVKLCPKAKQLPHGAGVIIQGHFSTSLVASQNVFRASRKPFEQRRKSAERMRISAMSPLHGASLPSTGRGKLGDANCIQMAMCILLEVRRLRALAAELVHTQQGAGNSNNRQELLSLSSFATASPDEYTQAALAGGLLRFGKACKFQAAGHVKQHICTSQHPK